MDALFNMPCVILCGGKSQRMGEDKSLLPFGVFDSLAQYQYERLKPYFQEIYISCKNPEKYSFKAEFIEDEHEDFHPFNGILSAFSWTGLPYLFFIPVDTPLLSIGSIQKIFAQLDCSVNGVIATENGKNHGLIGVYSSSIIPKIEKLMSEDDHKIEDLLQVANFNYAEFEESGEFMNLNSQKEYQEALIRQNIPSLC